MAPKSKEPMKRTKKTADDDEEWDDKQPRKVRRKVTKTLQPKPNELVPSIENDCAVPAYYSTDFLEIYNSILVTHKMLPTRDGFLFVDEVLSQWKWAKAKNAELDKARKAEQAKEEEQEEQEEAVCGTIRCGKSE